MAGFRKLIRNVQIVLLVLKIQNGLTIKKRLIFENIGIL